MDAEPAVTRPLSRLGSDPPCLAFIIRSLPRYPPPPPRKGLVVCGDPASGRPTQTWNCLRTPSCMFSKTSSRGADAIQNLPHPSFKIIPNRHTRRGMKSEPFTRRSQTPRIRSLPAFSLASRCSIPSAEVGWHLVSASPEPYALPHTSPRQAASMRGGSWATDSSTSGSGSSDVFCKSLRKGELGNREDRKRYRT